MEPQGITKNIEKAISDEKEKLIEELPYEAIAIRKKLKELAKKKIEEKKCN